MLKKILNPGGMPLGPLEFSTKGESINVYTPNNQTVDSRKAAAKQVNQMQKRLREKNVHSERSAESCAMWRKVLKEEALIGLLHNENAQESTRRRQKYCESQFLNEVESSPNASYESHQDCTSPDIFDRSRSPPWYKYTSTADMEATDLEETTGFWLTNSQFTLSEKTKADIYYYGFTILFLLILVYLSLCFL